MPAERSLRRTIKDFVVVDRKARPVERRANRESGGNPDPDRHQQQENGEDPLRHDRVEAFHCHRTDVRAEEDPERDEQRGADVDIDGADILVAGGRGLGTAEGFELCNELAAALGPHSAVAATRAVVDAGWYPYAGQIGQTGKTVAPKLYVAAGISGAIQHKVGMAASENIVAINKDANAPIFEFSDLGIVGDLNKILPKLTEAVKAKKGA